MKRKSYPAIRANLRSLAFAVTTNGKLGSCYLAGPMTGLPDFNMHAFEKCAEVLRDAGWTVYSPVENDKNDGVELEGTTGHETFDYRRAMAWDLQQVCLRDAVIVMPGWEYSKGCLLEVHTALEVGTPVYTYLGQTKIEELPVHEPGFSSRSGSTAGSCPAPGESAGTGAEDDRASEAPTQVLPVDSAARKSLPLATGVIDYFPAALAAVAEVSRVGNDKHNPGEPLHWARGKSMDQADAIARHLVDRGKIDAETGLRHTAEGAWRYLALLQIELEEEEGAPLPRGARLDESS